MSKLLFNEKLKLSKGADILSTFNVNESIGADKKKIYIDNFHKRRDLKWTTVYRDIKGFSITPHYGEPLDWVYEIDEELVPYNVILKKHDLPKPIHTEVAGTIKSGNVVRLSDGTQFNDVMYMISNFLKKNMFELSFDVYFDENTPYKEMEARIIFKGMDTAHEDNFYMTHFYYAGIGVQGQNLVLGSVITDERGNSKDVILASINDRATIIERGQWYRLTVKFINNIAYVYFHRRVELPILYISYDVRSGEVTQGETSMITYLTDTSNVVYKKPEEVFLDGDQMGIYTPSSKCYFANISYTSFEQSDLHYGKVFECESLTDIVHELGEYIGNLEADKNIKKIRTTLNNINLIQIGSRLFIKKNTGTYFLHDLEVSDFEVDNENIYVVERNFESGEKVVLGTYIPDVSSAYDKSYTLKRYEIGRGYIDGNGNVIIIGEGYDLRRKTLPDMVCKGTHIDERPFRLTIYNNDMSYIKTPNVISNVFQEEPFTIYLNGFNQTIDELLLKSRDKCYILTGPSVKYCVSGRIFNSNQEPLFRYDVEDVLVEAEGYYTLTEETNEYGQYKISGIHNGMYTITPVKKGFYFMPDSRTFPVSANVNNIDFYIYPDLYNISGAIV